MAASVPFTIHVCASEDSARKNSSAGGWLLPSVGACSWASPTAEEEAAAAVCSDSSCARRWWWSGAVLAESDGGGGRRDSGEDDGVVVLLPRIRGGEARSPPPAAAASDRTVPLRATRRNDDVGMEGGGIGTRVGSGDAERIVSSRAAARAARQGIRRSQSLGLRSFRTPRRVVD